MTNEKDTRDPSVSATYRKLATEEPSAELDEQVLAMATRIQRTPYGMARAWIRPVAWAATIGLSLAFLLEMSQFTPIDQQKTMLQKPLSAEQRAIADEAVTKAKAEKAQRLGVPRRTAVPTAAVASGAEAALDEPEQACGDTVRTSAESWYECIENLRDQGKAEQAAVELEEMRLAVPSFEIPVTE